MKGSNFYSGTMNAVYLMQKLIKFKQYLIRLLSVIVICFSGGGLNLEVVHVFAPAKLSQLMFSA